MGSKELASKAQELKELKRMQEELEAEITAIEKEIKAEMTARETDELTAGAFKIRWKVITGSRLDQRSLKAELPELFARYSVETIQRRFSIA